MTSIRSNRFSKRFFGCLLSLFLTIFKCPIYKPLDEDFNDTSCFGLCTKLNVAFQHVQPRLEPVYNKYAAPHIDTIAPYAQQASNIYNVHVAPITNAIYSRGLVIARPLVDKSSNTLALAKEKIQPYYTTITDKLDPVLSTIYSVSSVIYTRIAQPLENRLEPHVIKLSTYVLNKGSQLTVSTFHTVHKEISILLSRLYFWIESTVIPRSIGFYRGSVEPHVYKIYDQIIEKGTSKNEEIFSSSTSFLEPLSTASLVVEASIDSVSSSSIISSSSTTEKIAPTTSASSTSLEDWRKAVDDTSKEAFATFLDDAELEKRKIIDEVTPKFTELLQKLSSVQTETVTKLTELVDSIPDGKNEKEDDIITPDTIKEAFKQRTEELKDAALEVRKYSEIVANRILEKTEQVRGSTLDVFDEFADVALSEMGRNLVSIDAKNKIPSSKPSSTNWKEWKEFRMLKDRLVDVREEIVDHEINMAEVNQLLRDAQDTAHVLTQEAAEYLRSLKMRSDFNFQQAALNRNKRLEKQGIEIQDEEPVDAIIYDELEDEESEKDSEHGAVGEKEPVEKSQPVEGDHEPAEENKPVDENELADEHELEEPTTIEPIDEPDPIPEPDIENEENVIEEQPETTASTVTITPKEDDEEWDDDDSDEPGRIVVTRTFFETFGETPHPLNHEEL